jgi:hypothetical protein
MGNMKRGEFYEEDEPVEAVDAAFAAGDKFVTAAPDTGSAAVRGWAQSLRFPGRANRGDTYLAQVAKVRNA